jgi:hypothetical protein
MPQQILQVNLKSAFHAPTCQRHGSTRHSQLRTHPVSHGRYG